MQASEQSEYKLRQHKLQHKSSTQDILRSFIQVLSWQNDVELLKYLFCK